MYLNNGTWETGKLNFTADTLFIEPGDGYVIKANYPDGSVWFGIPNEDGNFLDRNWKKGG